MRVGLAFSIIYDAAARGACISCRWSGLYLSVSNGIEKNGLEAYVGIVGIHV